MGNRLFSEYLIEAEESADLEGAAQVMLGYARSPPADQEATISIAPLGEEAPCLVVGLLGGPRRTRRSSLDIVHWLEHQAPPQEFEAFAREYRQIFVTDHRGVGPRVAEHRPDLQAPVDHAFFQSGARFDQPVSERDLLGREQRAMSRLAEQVGKARKFLMRQNGRDRMPEQYEDLCIEGLCEPRQHILAAMDIFDDHPLCHQASIFQER